MSFSGGCDSSLVLSAATVACRQNAHDDPIPITYRFSAAPDTDEHEYQQAMVDHLELGQWIVLDIDDADLVGPGATALLGEYGPSWPASMFATAAALRDIAPGLLLTGEGGDDVLGWRRLSPASDAARAVVRNHRVPPPPLIRAAAVDVMPRALRNRGARVAIDSAYAPDWLEPELRDRLVATAAELEAAEPRSTTRWLNYHLRLPWVWQATNNLQALHARLGFRWEAPLLSPAFLGALDGSTRWWEYRGRTALLRRHFAELLPGEIVERTSKASFGNVQFGPHTHEFAQAWDGTGCPDGVDAERLREHWLSDDPHIGTAMLLHHAWLAANPPRAERAHLCLGFRR